MRKSIRWWMVALVALLLLVPSCTSNNLDESDADVILKVLSINNPKVEGELGTCQGDNSKECENDGDCPPIDGEPTGPCLLPPEPCTITEWSVTMENEALNPNGEASPYNDIEVLNVAISYVWATGDQTPTRHVDIGKVIEAGSTGSVSFFPITPADLVADNTSVELKFTFNAQTISGHHPVSVFGGQGDTLIIENCGIAVP